MRNRQQKRGQKKKRQSNGGFPKKYLELGLIGDNHFVEKLGDDKATKLLLLNAHIVSSNSKYLFNPRTSKRGGGVKWTPKNFSDLKFEAFKQSK